MGRLFNKGLIMSKLIKMQKGEILADVHPNMIDDYKKGGYEEVKQEIKKKAGNQKASSETGDS